MRMLDDEDSNDIEVTWVDQEKINQFSRLNTRQSEAQQQLEAKREEKEQVDEVFEEVEMLELNEGVDDEELLDEDLDDESNAGNTEGAGGASAAHGRKLPFKIGDAFVYVTLEKGIKLLEEEREQLQREIESWEEQVVQCESGMKALKVELYAKFGSNINLERD